MADSKEDTSARALFGQLALSKGFVTREQLLEALDDQARLRGHGEAVELGQVFIRKGLLTTDQFIEILRLQNRCLFKCTKCGRGFNVLGVPRDDRTLKCIACGAELEIPSTVHELTASLGDHLAVTAETAGPVQAVRLKIGRYELVREIARGGMGIVFEARDPALNRRIALKVIKETPRTRDLVKRLYREAEIAANLRHTNIVSIHEVGTDGNTHYIAMEFIDGATLQQEMEKNKLSPRDAARILADVAAAVHHAHARGVIHRDIKPGNIMFDGSRRVVVTDFGLARAEAHGSRLTQIGSPLGTPHYMAPEQAKGHVHEMDAQSDVWALGVVLFETLAGRRPFEGESPIEVYTKIMREPPAPLEGVDAGLKAICLQALEKEKAARFPSAKAMEEALRAWLAGSPPTARAPATPAAPPEPRPILRWAIAVVVALAAIAIVALVRDSSSRSSRVAELKKRIAELEKDRKFEDAARAHEELASLDPASAAPSAFRAHQLRDQARQAAAQEEVTRAIARARAARDRGDAAAAVREYLAVVARDPSHSAARVELADLAWQRMIAAEREDRDAAAWRMLVEQYHDGRYAKELDGTGALEVATVPPDAKTSLDGRPFAGKLQLAMGTYLLVARRDGFAEARVIVRIGRRQEVGLSVRLRTAAQIGDDYVFVPASEVVLGDPAQPAWVGDVVISRRPLSARTWAQAQAHVEQMTRDAQAKGEHVTFRLVSETEWEKAVRWASVYGLAELGPEWCSDPFATDDGRHAIRGAGLHPWERRAGGTEDTAAFRIVKVLED